MDRRITLAACLGAALAAAGCATESPTLPRSNVAAAPPTCAEIAASRAAAREGRENALEERASAWKVVVPFAAAARITQSTAELAVAERRIEALDAKYRRMGCGLMAE